MYEADHWFLLLGSGQKLCRFFLGGTADFTDHDDGFGLLIGQEKIKAVDEIEPVHRIAANTDTGGLAEPRGGCLRHRLIGQRAGPRDDADIARLMDVAGHDPDLTFIGRDDAGAVGANQPCPRATKGALHLVHIEHRDALGDADHQGQFGVDSLQDRVRRQMRGHIDRARIGARLLNRLLHGIEYGQPQMLGSPFARRDATHHLGAVGDRLLRMESALAAGLVMGIMIIPFVSSLSDDFINAVPQALRDGAYSLGATQSETIKQVILPAALPGIVGGVLLAVSRAIGETMIVVMAAGLSANLTMNPLKAVTTVTVQIVTLLVGDQEFDSPKTLAAFALGLLLFVVTLMLNVIALRVVRKYREQYE